MQQAAAFLLTLALGLALSAAWHATPMTVEVALSPDLEVPPVTSDALGSAFLRFDFDGPVAANDFEIRLTAITTPLFQAHIHRGAAGEIGDVVSDLCDLRANGCEGGPGEVEISGIELNLAGAATQADNAHIDFHTEGFVSEELRGHIPEPTTALLFASGLVGLGIRSRRCKRRV